MLQQGGEVPLTQVVALKDQTNTNCKLSFFHNNNVFHLPHASIREANPISLETPYLLFSATDSSSFNSSMSVRGSLSRRGHWVLADVD